MRASLPALLDKPTDALGFSVRGPSPAGRGSSKSVCGSVIKPAMKLLLVGLTSPAHIVKRKVMRHHIVMSYTGIPQSVIKVLDAASRPLEPTPSQPARSLPPLPRLMSRLPLFLPPSSGKLLRVSLVMLLCPLTG